MGEGHEGAEVSRARPCGSRAARRARLAAVCLRAVRVAAAPPLRVCADPNNLPFSNAAGEGFENKIAVADRATSSIGRCSLSGAPNAADFCARVSTPANAIS